MADVDPFDSGEKVPSIGWQVSRGVDYPVGTEYDIELDEAPKKLQSRNYDTNEPDWWDADKTQPKMSAVLTGTVISGPQGVGERRSVWANIPSNLFAALKDAQKEEKFKPKSRVKITFTGSVPHENPKKNDIKQYAAKHTPPTAFGGSNAEPPF